jgi:peptidoglycan/xylan/chitin deacetylase (PgdA/CDA1 family)
MGSGARPVILMYHAISDGGSALHIPPALFAEQMEWLHANARVLPLAEVATQLAEQKPLPERAVVLTFDDGFADFATYAAPVLLRLGMPATVFLPTEYCGRSNAWPGQAAWVKPEPLLTWAEIRRLAGEGIGFGGHTRSHCRLTRVPLEVAEKEIRQSREDIETHAGVTAEYFCYPYGLWNRPVRDLVALTYRAACSTFATAVPPDADLFVLPRVDIHYLRQASLFRSLFTPRFQAYVWARRTIRRLRGRPEGSYGGEQK